MLNMFVQKTQQKKVELEIEYTLFLRNIGSDITCVSIKPLTFATCLTGVMADAGIDTEVFKAHSLRSISSIKSVQRGISILSVK